MKKLLLYIFSLIALFTIYSCNNLDLNPQDSLNSSTFWKTESDIQSAVAGVYSKMKAGHLDYRRYWVDNVTDNSYNWAVYRGQSMVQSGNIEASTGGIVSENYYACYKGIAACNMFMKNFPIARGNVTLSDETANKYEAEVRFLRALYYFELVQLYGDIPLYKEEIESVEASKVKQSSEADVLAFVNEDLDYAIANLPNTAYSGHAVKGSAQALKARVALYQKNYATTASLTKELIQGGIFKLADNMNSVFIKTEGEGQANNPEILFSVTYLKPNYLQYSEMTYYFQVEIAPMQNLIDCYETGDKRLKEWYAPVLTPGGKTFTTILGTTAQVEDVPLTGWILLKHLDKYNSATYTYSNYDFRTDNDVPVLRMADVYLMYIEAMIEQNGGSTNDAVALDCMNKIRSRAGVSSMTSISRDKLRLERRRELAFEGLRYFDLKRWGILGNVMTSLVTPAGKCIWKDHYTVWPFPQDEMDVNPQLDQKAGY